MQSMGMFAMRFSTMAFAVFIVALGCSPSSGEKPATPTVAPAATGKPTAPEEPTPAPGGEFQGAPTLPPPAALPKLADEAAKPTTDQPPKSTDPADAKPVFKTRTGKHSGIPFDPIKENGPIFVDWPKPKAAIVISGMEDGYIEPCGCAGLDRMKGGMSRRATFLDDLRKQGWPLVVVDVGGIARGFGRQAEMKFQTLVDGKTKMGYDVIGFGVNDLKLPAAELVSVAAGVEGKPSLFVSANVGLFGLDQEITPTSRVVEAGGLKIGVTAIVGKKYQESLRNPEIEMIDPSAALKQIVPELAKKVDYLVLLSHATKDESIALAREFPQFNVVVTSNGAETPPARPEKIPGQKTLLVEVGHKGMEIVVLGIFDAAAKEVRYQRVPLDSRFAASPAMKSLMAAYQEQLKSVGLAGLALRPAPHPLTESNGRFVGSKKCESCHEESYNVWKKSKHAHAFETLATLDPPRDFDPECISCHVVGWHPTEFFPYASGYEGLQKTPQLINTGCEDCHGPGEKHVAAELGSNEALQTKYRKAMVITKEESKKRQCMTCHDLDNSPDFDFDAYYPQIEHHEEK